MKHKFSLIIASLIMMLFIVVPAAFFLESYTEEKILEFEHSELKHVAEAVRFALPSIADTEQDTQATLLNQTIIGLAAAMEARISLIDRSGKLLADSAQTPFELASSKNLSEQPEIKQAYLTGHGHVTRTHEMADYKVMHVTLRLTEKEAARFSSQPGPLVIRITRPLSLIDDTISGFHNELLKVGAAISLLAVLMSIAGVWFLSRQMQHDSDSLEARVEDRTEEVVMLQMLSSLLNTCGSLEEASKVLSELVPKLLPYASGGISIYKASRNRLDLFCQWGPHFQGQPSLNPHDCWALRKGHQHHATTRGVRLPCDHWTGDANETLCIPLLAQGETVGVLHLDYFGNDHRQQATHIREAIAEQTGLTLANIQLRQQLREQARRDPMTGLYNRLHLMEVMESFFQDKGESLGESAVLMLDADHFKRFNDNFGHDAGDLVLKAIAKEIRRATESSGLACRYGGEEFCVFVANADKALVTTMAESIRHAISDLNLSINNLPLGTVTMSIGIAFGPEHAQNEKALISLADAALYEAKEAGRDQVVIYAPAEKATVQTLKKAS